MKLKLKRHTTGPRAEDPETSGPSVSIRRSQPVAILLESYERITTGISSP